MALRRMWWVLVLGILATVGMACSGPSAHKVPQIDGGVSTGEKSGVPTQQQTGGSSHQTAGNGSKVQSQNGGAVGDSARCKDCQSASNSVKLSDADGYEFETGEAEAKGIQAGKPAKGDEKPATFDAGRGLTGTTGSSNLKPR